MERRIYIYTYYFVNIIKDVFPQYHVYTNLQYYHFDNKLTNKQDKMLTYNHDPVNVQLNIFMGNPQWQEYKYAVLEFD